MNHGHLLITVNVMYDPLIYLTEEECFPNIQQMVEAPEIYMFGRSTDSIADKLSFIAERRIDLESLKEPVVDEVTNIQYKDRLRFFRGDHPEQQFEAGQTVGGKFPCVNCTSNAGLFDYPAHCFRAQHRSLQDRRNQVRIVVFSSSYSISIINIKICIKQHICATILHPVFHVVSNIEVIDEHFNWSFGSTD